ncbi:hypothetical protein NIES4071_02610 [Calothrix sp. NIES-4071]|nr:hypothetical protein NIES4071_02610 [Calothrix sp. NIES-4071]BAZ54607.1 hypothetical protein NIES4105_02600 [Calothrix sp. NIES-4105]
MSRNQTKSKVGLCKTLKHAITLNTSFYEQVRNIPQNRRLALTIVILAAVSHAIGTVVILVINLATVPVLFLGFLIDVILIIVGYYLWTYSIWKIGQWFRPIDPTYGDLLSPIGFAYAPQVFNFLTLVPLFGRPIELILGLWSLLAVITAVRQSLHIRTRQAAIICLIGWSIIQILIGFLQFLQQELIQ